MQDNFFSAVYKYAPVGVMILDEDENVVNINPFLLSMLSLTADHCKSRHFSSALQCASVFGAARSCGEMPACENCRLRQCIQNALSQGQPVRCAVLSHSFVIDGAPAVRTFRFSVSAVDARQGRRAVVSVCDITREKQYELLLTHELDLEAAPNVINRQSLIGLVAGLLRQAGPDNTLSVGMAVLEGPQRAGEQSGTVGEDTLNRFAEIARQCTRRQDIIGRFEGDSFLFIFSGAGIHMAAAIARRIHDTMAAVFAVNDIRGVSFSAGFMELSSRQLTQISGDEILRVIDGCLRTARERGGSLFVSKELIAKLKG